MPVVQSDTAEENVRRLCKWDAQKLVDPAARGTDEGAVVELDGGVHRRGSGEGQCNVSEDEGKLGKNEEDHRGSAAVGSDDREDCVDVNTVAFTRIYTLVRSLLDVLLGSKPGDCVRWTHADANHATPRKTVGRAVSEALRALS